MNVLIEALEGRKLFSTTAEFPVTSKGTLMVQGTGGDDVIQVGERGGGTFFAVSVNGQVAYTMKPVKRIYIDGAAGTDRINYDGAVNLPVTLLGGAGGDRLGAVGPNVLLSGGAGNDDLFGGGDNGITYIGGRGGDRMFGTNGADAFFGGAGDDYAAVVTFADAHDSVERIFAVAS